MVTVVFGARGSVGRHVVAGLRAGGEQVRLTSRNPAAAGFPDGVQAAEADLERPETLGAALDGAQQVFLYARPRGIDGFVAAARAAGVRRVALLSSAAVTGRNPERNPIARDHRVVELALEESGIPWTFIRPGLFATNTLWWWQRSIRDENAARLPYPDAQTSPVHEKDLAALAVSALIEDGHEGRAYTVYGPQSLTLREQVALIAAAVGREVRVEEISPAQARTDLSRTISAAAAEAILGAWEAGLSGPARTSKVVQEVTGRPGLEFAQWAADHADDFR
jgi:uncharacterized protein YbjT (DUF2867 family)